MEHNAVVWFEIYVQDMGRARKFYETVLSIKLEKHDAPSPDLEMWTFAYKEKAMGASGALVKMDGVSPGGSGVMVYFASADCAIEEARIEAAGGKVHRSKFSIAPYGFITVAQDTEGNMFGLHSM
jgi:Predicted enzyme related to lactoylglutathione lyase